MPDANRLQHRVEGGYIQIVTRAGEGLPAYWSHPEQGGSFPGLVLLHDNRGLTAHIRAVVHRFAEIGYYVVAPDMFDRQQPASEADAHAMVNFYQEKAFAKATAALLALESHRKCNSKMAVIGWDFGGTLTFEISIKRVDVMAVVAFYGNPQPFFGQFKETLSPTMALFGENDEILKEHERQLREELIRTGQSHEVIVYPNAGHHFYNDSLSQYDAEASKDAWRQTLAWLETHQGKPLPPVRPLDVPFGPDGVF